MDIFVKEMCFQLVFPFWELPTRLKRLRRDKYYRVLQSPELADFPYKLDCIRLTEGCSRELLVEKTYHGFSVEDFILSVQYTTTMH